MERCGTWSIDVAAQLALDVFDSISFDFSKEDAKAMGGGMLVDWQWRMVYIDGEKVYGKIDEQKLARAVEYILVNGKVDKRRNNSSVRDKIVQLLYEQKKHNSQHVRESIESLFKALLAEKPSKWEVYMPIYGISIDDKTIIGKGDFSFMSADWIENIHIPHLYGLDEDDIKSKIWPKCAHVGAIVCANDGEKAREIAAQKFEWLQNAMRFFIDDKAYRIGITNFDFGYAENSLAIQSDGVAASMSSSLKGTIQLLPIKKLLELRPFDVMLSMLGDSNRQLTDMQRRVKHAIYLGGMSSQVESMSLAYFLCVSALEALFQHNGNQYVNPSIAQQIIEAFCYLIVAPEERRKCADELQSSYGKRSAIAHGASKELSESEVQKMRSYLRIAVCKLLMDAELSKIKTTEELLSIVKHRKFGGAIQDCSENREERSA